jgi:3-hydroxyisobutyrate dehydrogenase-like beta-hydroxyacid dehydrogenase
MRVGFLGLGEMGRPMAGNLLKGGHSLSVWNRSPGAARTLGAAGAQVATHAAEAFAAEVVFVMLADDQALRDVLLDSGLVDRLEAPLTIVNMATISVDFAEELAGRCTAADIAYVSAPVMGRPDAAAAAKLNILAAGPSAAIDAVESLFQLMGQKTWRLGDHAPTANAMKLTINFMLASAVETLGEAMALANGHGIRPDELLTLITSTVFPGPVYQGYGALMAAGRFEPAAFKAALGLKDVRLALAAAEAAAVPLPVASAVRDALIDAVAHGEGQMDLAVLGKVAARRAGR